MQRRLHSLFPLLPDLPVSPHIHDTDFLNTWRSKQNHCHIAVFSQEIHYFLFKMSFQGPN